MGRFGSWGVRVLGQTCLWAAASLCLCTAGSALAASPSSSDHRLPIPAVVPQAEQAPPADPAVLDLPIDPWSPRAEEAAAFANGVTLRTRAIFADPNLATAGRRQALKTLVLDVFDLKALGGMLLGDNRGKLSEAQQAQYETMVAEYLADLYSGRMIRACAESPEVVSVEEQPGGIVVRTAYAKGPNEPQTMIDWLIAPQADGSWRVLDFAVNGVSLAKAKIEEFASVLKNEGADAFLQRLHGSSADNSLPASPRT